MSIEATQAADWIEWARFVSTVLAPFLALGGAIWLFFIKHNTERETELRLGRQNLYARYLQELQEVETVNKSATMAVQGIKIISYMSDCAEELRLVAPDPVVVSHLKFMNTHSVDTIGDVGSKYLHDYVDSTELIQVILKQRDARLDLITEMRKDVLKGSKVPVDLTRVEDLKS